MIKHSKKVFSYHKANINNKKTSFIEGDNIMILKKYNNSTKHYKSKKAKWIKCLRIYSKS